MWILQFLPNWIFYYILFGSGIGLLVAKFLPKYYKELVAIVSAIFFAFGLFMVGAISNEETWQARVKEMEAKVAEAEVQSVKENIKLVEKVVTKTQVVKQRGEDIIKYVDKEIVKYDNTCVIPKEFIEAHNRAATK